MYACRCPKTSHEIANRYARHWIIGFLDNTVRNSGLRRSVHTCSGSRPFVLATNHRIRCMRAFALIHPLQLICPEFFGAMSCVGLLSDTRIALNRVLGCMPLPSLSISTMESAMCHLCNVPASRSHARHDGASPVHCCSNRAAVGALLMSGMVAWTAELQAPGGAQCARVPAEALRC